MIVWSWSLPADHAVWILIISDFCHLFYLHWCLQLTLKSVWIFCIYSFLTIFCLVEFCNMKNCMAVLQVLRRGLKRVARLCNITGCDAACCDPRSATYFTFPHKPQFLISTMEMIIVHKAWGIALNDLTYVKALRLWTSA